MAEVYIKTISVNKIARNKRPYGHGSNNNVSTESKTTDKATVSEVITATSETVINKYLAPDHIHLLEAYCVGGRGDDSQFHAAQVIATDPAIPGVTIYADQNIIW